MKNFDRIAGYETEKKELEVLVDIFNNRTKYREKGASLPKGIIFYGDAGTGKTLFSQVLAAECALKTITVDIAKAVGAHDICRLTRKAFIKAARSHYPTMIFFDELDKVLPNESEEYYTDQSKAVLTQLLTLIDGMDTVDNIVFVATCNDYDALPESLRRPGRFDKKIRLGLPTYSSRVAILQMYMDASSCRFALNAENIAKLCAGFSCAALKTLVNECVLRSDEHNFIDETLVREKVAEIEGEDLVSEKNEIAKTVQAVHNIGCFLATTEYNKGDYLLSLKENTVCNAFLDSVISNFDYDYDDEYEEYDEEDDERKSVGETPFSKNDFLAAITSLLAGYAAEELILHKTHDTLYSTMSIIDRILIRMAECGMLGWGLLYNDGHGGEPGYSQSFLERLEATFERIVTECYESAKVTVAQNERLIKKLLPILVKRESLEKSECEEIIFELGGIA